MSLRLHPNVRRYIGYLWIIVAFMVLAGTVALYIARKERFLFPWEHRMHIEA